ncbi:SDR family oxidoreductase [Pontivivens insulae]|uniref:Enoyl-[acyl-carrier-protein] reductase [NADPH] FabL n=1 Tax=Pontivivens insulae TaxID=1639689 RepID=A0A2R8AAV8_9RHOB|nr:SDR family oxidoreductase [Pontivivens insulae]RED13275.1 NAD(P)-dependent dehydrogenase (short-subunit alcohol dehydrogenase family) [Pontivivens insulae]SPF29367.1 Enoyl-[acyl-carrier-protein] reductase [NADPH] FabL [Pontivivens insulae]
MPTALITGGARRIGAAIATELAAQGFDIALHYNSSSSEADALAETLRASGIRCETFRSGFTSQADLIEMMDRIEASLGPLDLLVNNASAFFNDEITEIDEAQFDTHLMVNLKAPIFLASAMARQNHSGNRLIVNMLDNKLFALNPDFLTYTLSKSALHTSVEMLSRKLAGQIRVCGIAPSITLISGKQSVENFEKSRRINPLERAVSVEDIARTVTHLWQNDGLNGEVILLDGGQALWHLPRDVAFYVKDGTYHG